jgi:hypothetical protein
MVKLRKPTKKKPIGYSEIDPGRSTRKYVYTLCGDTPLEYEEFMFSNKDDAVKVAAKLSRRNSESVDVYGYDRFKDRKSRDHIVTMDKGKPMLKRRR